MLAQQCFYFCHHYLVSLMPFQKFHRSENKISSISSAPFLFFQPSLLLTSQWWYFLHLPTQLFPFFFSLIWNTSGIHSTVVSVSLPDQPPPCSGHSYCSSWIFFPFWPFALPSSLFERIPTVRDRFLPPPYSPFYNRDQKITLKQ